MQLREYLSILRRAWPIVLLPPLIAGLVSLVLALRQPPAYQAAARLLITQAPTGAPAVPLPALDDGATWATTEYILDDLPFVVGSAAFAADVSAAMAAEGYPLDPAAIPGALATEVTHRAVSLTGTAATPDMALALVRGAIAALQRGGLSYWGRAASGGLQVAVLDPPVAAPANGPRDLALDVGLRVILALAAGVGLAFLLHALDDRLRSRSQAEEWTGAHVIGVIPKER